jgi:hypothetical protein
MNNEDHLFHLINSLDQGEKRFISLNTLKPHLVKIKKEILPF